MLGKKDYATQTVVQWFITQRFITMQIEEEKNTGQFLEQLKATGDRPAALFVFDSYLGKRGD